MKIFPARRFVSPLIFGALILSSISQVRSEPKEISSQAAPQQEYRLFVGIDVKVMAGGDFMKVAAYENGFTHVAEEGVPKIYKHDLESIDYDHLPRLGRNPVSITNLKASRERGMDHETLKWMNRQNQLRMYNDVQVDQLEAQINAAHQTASAQSETLAPGEVKPEVRVAENALQGYQLRSGQIADGTFYADRISGKAKVEPNALKISATLSSPVLITDAYLAFVTRTSAPEEGYTDSVFFHHVGDLGTEPREIEFYQEGFPEGFHLKTINIHLFKNGREIVSNVSPKQFPLSRRELHEYVALERVSMHRGETIPAEPIWTIAPPALLASSDPRDFDFPVVVEVDEMGRVTAIDSKAVLPESVRSVVKDLVFKPALEAGEPVASQAEVSLRDFFQK
ncbi:MAG: hypothetical protein SynsKO_31680 [Synoicihabitans sp.]